MSGSIKAWRLGQDIRVQALDVRPRFVKNARTSEVDLYLTVSPTEATALRDAIDGALSSPFTSDDRSKT